MSARTRSASISGLTRYDLGDRLTVPDGTSTMVAIINEKVEGEETFLFRPGGAGQGYEANPYRVIRFKNSTPFALESGPISIYSGGSFVGEGISEPVSAGVAVTIPFAVESSLLVASHLQYGGDEMRLVKIVRGVIEVENFARRSTTWEVTSQQPRAAELTLYVRHPKAGGNFKLAPRPDGTEDLPDAYLIPIKLAANATTAKLDVVEQTPSRSTLSIWDTSLAAAARGHPRPGHARRGDPRQARADRQAAPGDRPDRHRDRGQDPDAPRARSARAGDPREPRGDQAGSRRGRAAQAACRTGSTSSPRTATSSAASSSSCRPSAPSRRSPSRTRCRTSS